MVSVTADEAKEKANKLITLLSNNKDVTQMRKDGQFNFEQLSRGANKVTIADC